MNKDIREEVEELLQVLGVLHTRLNNLVNQIRDRGDQGKAGIIIMVEFSFLVQANTDLGEAWDSLQYSLNPEV